MVKRSLYAAALLLILLGAAGFVEYDAPPRPKAAPLTDAVSLRELPGPDGCMPAPTYTPPHRFKGEIFPDVCVSATVTY